MAEQYTREMDGHCASHPEAEHTTHEYSTGPDTIDLPDAGSLLSNARLTGHISAPQRSAAVLQLQQTHGNRAVQRFIQRSPANDATPLSIQRDDDDEPLVPKFSPFPYPSLDLPFGKGSGIAANPSGLDFNWKLGGASGKLGYEYDGNLTGEANVGDYWLKGGLGKKGFNLGGGYGNPLITPPGIPPMGNDPSGDLRGGDLDPRTIGKSLDDMKDSKIKPGFSWGLQGGKDQDKGLFGWGGLQYNW